MEKEIIQETKNNADQKQQGKKANVKYKDGLFRMLFNDEEKALELYNALNGTNYGKETKVEMQTLEDTLFIDHKNDVSFTVNGKFIVFAEHQSTISPNMPVRLLSYAARTYEKLLGEDVYRQSTVTLPVPELYVFYNGSRKAPYESVYRLSDNFAAEAPGNSIEAVAKVINIGYNENKEVLRRCRTMREYSRFVYFVNEDVKRGISLEDSMRNAVKKAGREGILKEFFDKHGAEVMSMGYLFEISRERYEEMFQEDMQKMREELEQELEGIAQERKNIEQELEGIAQERKNIEQELEGIAQERENIEHEREGIARELEGIAQERETLKQELKTLKKESETLKKESETIKREKKKLEAEGEMRAQYRIAKALKGSGIDNAVIAQNTGLAEEEVESL